MVLDPEAFDGVMVLSTKFVRGGVALIVGLAVLTTGVAGAPLHEGTAGESDEVKRIANVEFSITDEEVTVSGVHVDSSLVPDRTIDERTHTIEDATVSIDGITVSYEDATFEIANVTLHVDDVTVTLEDITLGDG